MLNERENTDEEKTADRASNIKSNLGGTYFNSNQIYHNYFFINDPLYL
jgi:hypothetical protein